MNEDIELIGYGVKAGNNYVSGEDKDFSFFRSFRNGMFISKKVVKMFSDLDDAQEVANNLGGKVVEVYTREVRKDDNEDEKSN